MAAPLVLSRSSHRSVERIFARFADKFPAAIARALNRAGKTTRAVMAREIVADTGGIKVGDVKERIKVDEATSFRPVVRLFISGKRIPLSEFGVSGRQPSRGRGPGVRSRLRGGTPVIPGAFLATVTRAGEDGVHGGHAGVFKRDTRRGLQRKSKGAWGKNLPIRQLYGPSLPQVFNKVSSKGLEAGTEALVKNLRSEVRFAMGEAAQLNVG